MRLTLRLFTGLFCLLPLVASAIDIQTKTLKNGLEVAVVEDFRTPVVVHSVWYKAGSADEPAFAKNKAGIAHMLEHLMFKGQPSAPAGEFSKIVARMGGQDNAFTSRDMTAYWQRIGADKLPEVMKLEAERMHQLDIEDATFVPERAVVREERRLRIETQPISKFFEDLVKLHFGENPYSQPVIGSADEIMSFSLDDARRWYAQHYAPNNALMVIVGAVKAEDAFALAQQYYGSIPKAKVPARKWPDEPKFKQPRELNTIDAQIEVPLFYRLYRAPSVFAGVAGSDAPAIKTPVELMLLASALGDSSRGYLYRTLVEEQKIATAASLDYSGVMRGETSLDLYVQPADGVTLAQLQAALETALQNFSITEVELNRTKTELRAAWVYAQDDPYGIAYRVGDWLVTGGNANEYDAWLAAMDKVTVADVMAAHQKYLLQNTQYTTGRLAHDAAQLGE